MGKLKTENLKQCLSLLRQFVDKAGEDSDKGIAILALDQLQKITAGTDSPDPHGCHSEPKASGSPY